MHVISPTHMHTKLHSHLMCVIYMSDTCYTRLMLNLLPVCNVVTYATYYKLYSIIHSYILLVCIFYIVPAIYTNPDILILDDLNRTQSGLIDYDTVYNARWNTDLLNHNDFNETETEISFSIENWVFSIHVRTGVPRWLHRHELPSSFARHLFQIVQSNSNTGFFSFKQTARPFARLRFDINIIAVRKQTENLSILYTSAIVSFVPVISGLSGKDAVKEFCRRWYTRTDEIINSNNLTYCPCTLESATMNPELVVDFTCSVTEPDCHENVNAHRCFLKSINQRYVHAYVVLTMLSPIIE